MNTKDPRHIKLMACLAGKVLKDPESIISSEPQTTGTILLNSGIQDIAATFGLDIETEPAEDEDGPFAFMVARMDGIEVLQIDETYTPEGDE